MTLTQMSLLCFGVFSLISCASRPPANLLTDGSCRPTAHFTLVLHGGAGDTSSEERARRAPVLREILKAGHAQLARGKSALDVVTYAVRAMEDSAAFNAGRGAIANQAGVAELDASIADGITRRAGAVGAVHTLKNPILGARAVMEKSQNVFIVGPGADAFAKRQGLETVAQSYFLNHRKSKKPHGTVGAVALDQCGHLAAGTSTGGWDEKLPGRIGDSPVIGAGTFADDQTCAVSATGHGEYFIRWSVAHDISARVEYLGESIVEASARVVEKLKTVGGEGGVIALDRAGNFHLPYNSASMTRGYVKSDGELRVGFEGELFE